MSDELSGCISDGNLYCNMYIPNNAKFIRKRFAYQCLGNVKMYKYANFDQSTMLPCGSRVLLKGID